MGTSLSTIGLTLDIIGAVLLFMYGLPQRLDRDGHQSLILEQVDEEEAKLARKYDGRSAFGLVLLIIGFFLQLVGGLL